MAKYSSVEHVLPSQMKVFLEGFTAVKKAVSLGRALTPDEFSTVRTAIGHAFPSGSPGPNNRFWSDVYLLFVNDPDKVDAKLLRGIRDVWASWTVKKEDK